VREVGCEQEKRKTFQDIFVAIRLGGIMMLPVTWFISTG
jgi:hypothetical protein